MEQIKKKFCNFVETVAENEIIAFFKQDFNKKYEKISGI